MPMIRRAAALWVLLTVPALSSQVEPTDKPMLDTCFARGQGADCIGIITTPCLAEPGGETTIGTQRCFERGLATREVVLARQYARSLTRAEAINTAHVSTVVGACATRTLRVAHAACPRDLTAARALAFRARLAEGE